jgi:peptide chain release factor 1
MKNIYEKVCYRNNFNVSTVDWRDGFVQLKISGKGVKKFFENEIGGHRWQRVPPTEKNGRVHTSTVKVVIIEEYENSNKILLNDKDIERRYTKGTGAGGQRKNKVETCVVLTHKPTKISVRIDGRDRSKNEIEARKCLLQKLQDLDNKKFQQNLSQNIQQQIGTFRRGDKIRTYRVTDNIVNDHITNKSVTLKEVEKGFINLLH